MDNYIDNETDSNEIRGKGEMKLPNIIKRELEFWTTVDKEKRIQTTLKALKQAWKDNPLKMIMTTISAIIITVLITGALMMVDQDLKTCKNQITQLDGTNYTIDKIPYLNYIKTPWKYEGTTQDKNQITCTYSLQEWQTRQKDIEQYNRYQQTKYEITRIYGQNKTFNITGVSFK